MANLTKAERERRETENEAKLKAEIEAKIRKEYEDKLKSEKATITSNNPPKKKKIPLDTIVPVRSGVNGILTYVSKKTGYEINWENYGDNEYVELGDLLTMRNTQKSFYENNWIYFDDSDEYAAIDFYNFLEVYKYYDTSIIGNDLEDIFNKTPDEIKDVCGKVSKGIKNTIADMAKTKVLDGTLDSIGKIKALEEVLDIELTSK